MSQPVQLTDVWRRSLDATVQFYSALGELAVDCLETLLATTTNSNFGLNSDANAPTPAVVNQVNTAPQPPPVSMMVLEADVSRKAMGVFLVENGFSRAVSAAATASAFVDDQGNEINPTVEFQPASVTLQPGEQILVKVLATISRDMPAGIRYRGEIGVPGLMGTRIPVVLGRIAGAKASGSKKARATSTAGARSRTPGRNTRPRGNSKQRATKA